MVFGAEFSGPLAHAAIVAASRNVLTLETLSILELPLNLTCLIASVVVDVQNGCSGEVFSENRGPGSRSVRRRVVDARVRGGGVAARAVASGVGSRSVGARAAARRPSVGRAVWRVRGAIGDARPFHARIARVAVAHAKAVAVADLAGGAREPDGCDRAEEDQRLRGFRRGALRRLRRRHASPRGRGPARGRCGRANRCRPRIRRARARR